MGWRGCVAETGNIPYPDVCGSFHRRPSENDHMDQGRPRDFPFCGETWSLHEGRGPRKRRDEWNVMEEATFFQRKDVLGQKKLAGWQGLVMIRPADGGSFSDYYKPNRVSTIYKRLIATRSYY